MGGRESMTRTKVGNSEWGNGRALLEVERAGRTCPRALDDVQVDHGGGDVSMAEKILHGQDVGATLDETCRDAPCATSPVPPTRAADPILPPSPG